ncbi:LuxR C-terminal-related transcriptional regulator [Microvirga aerophila]|uniref:LuxR C-terminal-related transcriptional regulator n=1 Tax=Microvirga aerophila TaxID=670291 RepID=UPI001AECBA0D|nr:response regulator transcription factor [Microvirga aerophila]
MATIQVSRNPLLCLGLKSLLAETRFNVWKDPVHELSDVPSLPDESPVLFIVDGSQSFDGRLELIRELKALHPAARTVLMADRFDLYTLISAQDAGADGLFLTTVDREILVRSLELVMLGEVVVPSSLVREIMSQARHNTERHSADARTGSKASDPKGHRLSSRETEILYCLTEGSPNKVIARQLNLCEATVKVHIKAILRKIGVFNRTQAAMWAADHMPTKVEPLAENKTPVQQAQ